MSAKFRILDLGNGTGQIVDAKGRPLELESEDGGGSEPVIVQAGQGWFQRTLEPKSAPSTPPPAAPAAPSTESAPTTPKSDGPLSEADALAFLGTTPEGSALLADPARLAAHLAQLRAEGTIV